MHTCAWLKPGDRPQTAGLRLPWRGFSAVGQHLKYADSSFYERVRDSRKILVIAFGGLGDIVHSVPALRSVRASFPQARLDVLAPDIGADFLAGVEGIDHIIPHLPRQAGWTWANLRQFWQLFRARYELCINLWGSNHASVIALSTFARVRLGRMPLETWKRGWRLCNTHIADYPHLAEPMHAQWTGMLQALGFHTVPAFAVRYADPLCAASATGRLPARGYIHVSPSASEPAKELALPRMIEVLQGLQQRLPEYPLVISSPPVARHRERLHAMLAALQHPPLAVFDGTVDCAGLFCLVQNAALHVSSDSGPVHMAVAADTPSVSWFQENPSIREYLPPTERGHYAFVTGEPRAAGITGLAAADIVEQCALALRRGEAARPASTRGQAA